MDLTFLAPSSTWLRVYGPHISCSLFYLSDCVWTSAPAEEDYKQQQSTRYNNQQDTTINKMSVPFFKMFFYNYAYVSYVVSGAISSTLSVGAASNWSTSFADDRQYLSHATRALEGLRIAAERGHNASLDPSTARTHQHNNARVRPKSARAGGPSTRNNKEHFYKSFMILSLEEVFFIFSSSSSSIFPCGEDYALCEKKKLLSHTNIYASVSPLERCSSIYLNKSARTSERWWSN